MKMNKHTYKTLNKLKEITDIFENVYKIITNDEPRDYFIHGIVKQGANVSLNFEETGKNIYRVDNLFAGIIDEVRNFYGLQCEYCIGCAGRNRNYVYSKKIHELTQEEENSGIEIW